MAKLTGSANSKTAFTVSKSSDETTATDSTTVTTDTHLTLALDSATTYKVTAMVDFTQPSSGALVQTWTAPSGANLRGHITTVVNSTTARTESITEASSHSSPIGAAGAGKTFLSGYVETSAAAGNIVPTYRSGAADASAITIHAGSWLTVERL